MTAPALPGTLAVIGDSIGWVIGRHGGHRLLTRYGRYVLVTPHRLARAESFFTRHGSKIVPVARFFEGLRQVKGIIAGMTGVPWLKFLALNAVGAALWVGVWITAGDVAGRHISTIYPMITRYGTYELAALAVVAAVLLVRLGVRRLLVRSCRCGQ